MSQSLKSARERTKSGTALRPSNVVDLALPAAARCTSLRFAINADGFLDYEINIRREDADRVTDVLLLMLLAAREARAECGATSIGNRGNVNE